MSPQPVNDWHLVESVAVQTLLGILLRAAAQREADDHPGMVSAVEYRVQPEGSRLAVDVTVYGPADAPISGYSL